MLHHAKKILYFILITVLLNSSFHPLFAVYTFEARSFEEQPRSRLMKFEDFLQEKVKASVKRMQNVAPSLIKKPVARIYEGMSSWFGNRIMEIAPFILGKTPFDIDYANDLDFWRMHFIREIDELKNSGIGKFASNQERLEELQDIVWSGLLSPYHYEKELQALKINAPEFLELQNQFQKTLKSYPLLLRESFQKDLLTCLGPHDGKIFEEDINNFKGLLNYYREIQNPLDYTHNLVEFNCLIQQNKQALKITDEKYFAIKREIVKAVTQRDSETYRSLKKAQFRFDYLAQELPYSNVNDTDILEDTFNSALPSVSVKEVMEKSSPLMASAKEFPRLIHKGVKYAIDHPVQVMLTILANQVAATAALDSFRIQDRKSPYSLRGISQQPELSKEESLFQEKIFTEQSSSLLPPRFVKPLFGDEFQVNQNTTSNHEMPSVASLANGNVFVAWGEDAGNVYGRFFSIDGMAVGDEFKLNQITNGFQSHPSATNVLKGNTFATWDSYNFQGRDDVKGCVISAKGAVLANDFIINQNTSCLGPEVHPVTSLSNGNALVTWNGRQNGNSDLDVYGRIFSVNGTALNNEFMINQNTTSRLDALSVASLKKGNVFVTWWGNQIGSYDANIYGRIFSAEGEPLSNEFGINQVTSSNQFNPSAASLTNGNALVVWQGDQSGKALLYGRLFSANGMALSDEFDINQVTTSNQLNPSVTGLTNGNVLVVWEENDLIEKFDIYGRFFSANGEPLSNKFGINQVINSNQLNPFVSGLLNGDALVAWQGDQTGKFNIYGRIVSANNLITTGSSLTTDIFTTSVPTSTTGHPSTSSTTSSPSTSNQLTTESNTLGEATTQTFSSSTTGNVTSAANKPTPSWFLFPMKFISNSFNNLWTHI